MPDPTTSNLRVPAELVLKTKVIATYVGGQSVFEARKP